MAKKKNKKKAVPKPALPPAPTQIVKYEETLPTDLSITREPGVILDEASRAARALVRVAENPRVKGSVVISGRKFLKVEMWETVGRFFGVTARIREDKLLQVGEHRGAEAVADAIVAKTGQVISSAVAMCTDEEPNWDVRPEYDWRPAKTEEEARKIAEQKGWELSGYNHSRKLARFKVGESKVPLFQLRSMAQTRAISKALRNVFAWVVVLAGYEPTPAEEAHGWQYEPDEQEQSKGEPRRASEKPKEAVKPAVEAQARSVEEAPSDAKPAPPVQPQKPSPAPALPAERCQIEQVDKATLKVTFFGSRAQSVLLPVVKNTIQAKPIGGSWLIPASWAGVLHGIAEKESISWQENKK